jgi:predicted tellurium resistance membrane protein TerC
MELLMTPETWIAFLTLTALELVLGIDNIIFISILSGKLPKEEQDKARKTGLFLAMFMRIGLLFMLSWLVSLTKPLFTVFSEQISGRDLILLLGGLFLVAKSTMEIHERIEGDHEGHGQVNARARFGAVIFQILLLDIVFSLDSVITAVGMVDQVPVMVAAVVVSVGVMLAFSGQVSAFVQRHPTVKMLALAFLLLIGMSLVAEGLDHHIPKGYIYFAMAFSVLVETLNLKSKASHSIASSLGETSPWNVGRFSPGAV